MSSRKRSIRAVEDGSGDTEPSLLHRIRNFWPFANLCQWIYIFGKAAKIPDSIDVEEIEAECLKPTSSILDEIALSILKLASSHRGLTFVSNIHPSEVLLTIQLSPEIFDDQARKLFQIRLPESNPFGDQERPAKFSEFDIFTKIQVLQQLTQFTMIHPERIREKMEEQKDTEQTGWRIEPYGWDADDRIYYVLDDNRVYRLTEAPLPPTPKPKKSKTWRGGRRSSKRRRTTINSEDVNSDAEHGGHDEQPEDDGLGGMKWECLAVTLNEVQSIVEGFRKTRDENEKILRTQLEKHLLPILEKQEESRKRKEQQRERELMNLAKMANAKRSSRIASKVEQQKQDERIREEEQHRQEAEAIRRREEAKAFKRELDRDQRLFSREKRLQERDARRRQHEEELAHLSEDGKKLANANGRLSERRLQAEIERNKQALKEIEQQEEDWVFDCPCGLYGHVDDGTHSVACERCNVWQHSKCVGISEKDAERPEFQFFCSSCRREQEAKAHPRPTIKLKLHHAKKSPDSQGQQATNNSSFGEAALKNPFNAHEAKDQDLNRVSGHGSSGVASGRVNGFAQNDVSPSPGSRPTVTSPGPGQSGWGSSPGTRSILPAPVKLEAGEMDRQPQGGNPSQGTAAGSPAASVHTASPPNSFQSLQGSRSFESTLSTPKISRDIYRAAHVQNGTLPADGGLSPTKHSPPRTTDAGSANKISITTPILPPVANLSPSPRPQVLTPPSKPSEPPRPAGSPSIKQ